MTTDATPVPNPYVGPRPFEIHHQGLFFGRKREVNELLSLVISERLLLIYAQSGVGKTSLINAGLVPALKEEGFEVLPPARVWEALPDGTTLDDLRNPYTFNVLSRWSGRGVKSKQLANISLADFLEQRRHKPDEFGLRAPRALILDQFEELFTAYPERWEDRGRFLEQIAAALHRDPVLRVLLVMREEYIARLDPYADLLPGRLRAHFRLERLRQPAALEAVTGPLPEGYAYGKDVAERLVEELLQTQVESPGEGTMAVTGEFVEPVQLQVVCRSLWQALSPGDSEITSAHLASAGDLDQALADFYETSVAQACGTGQVSEASLRAWFEEHLITPTGTRGLVPRGPQATGGMPNPAVRVLEDLHLIRKQRRYGADWYELTHDRFVEPIRASNKKWRAARALEHFVNWSGDKVAHTVPDLAVLAGIEQGALEAVLTMLSLPQARLLRPGSLPPEQPEERGYERIREALTAAGRDWSVDYAAQRQDLDAQLAVRLQNFNAQYEIVRNLT